MKNTKVLVLFWALAVGSGMSLDLWHARQFLPPPEQRKADDILVDVFGEIKTVVARYLWFRMDMFHEALDDEGIAAEQQSEVLPLLRMVTLLDPSLTDSYDQIVWDLYKGHREVETARSLLNEGIKRNPKSYGLRFRRALIEYLEKQYQEAIHEAAVALTLTTEQFDQLNCLRLIFWSAKALNRTQLQLQAANDILTLRPDSTEWQNRKAELEKLGIIRRSGL